MSALCPNGHPNRSGAKFCGVCGARLSVPAAPSDRVPRTVSQRSGTSRVPPRGSRDGLRVPFGLIPTLPGALIVVAAFFVAWLNISSPLANLFLGNASVTGLSGYQLLTTAPASYKSAPTALICLAPFLAAGALVLGVLTAFRALPLRRLFSAGQMLFALGGIGFMVALLNIARAQPQEMVQSFGLSREMASVIATAVVQIEPALGFWLVISGFALVGLGGLVDLATQLIWS